MCVGSFVALDNLVANGGAGTFLQQGGARDIVKRCQLLGS